jgi:hypothetical protein
LGELVLLNMHLLLILLISGMPGNLQVDGLAGFWAAPVSAFGPAAMPLGDVADGEIYCKL